MENPIAQISRNPTKIETFFWRVKWAFVEWFNKHILQKKSNTYNIAKRELDVLRATTPDAIIAPFTKEILALCEAFGKSGQSGGSAPYTASAISQAVKHLMLQEPICPVTGIDEEWANVREVSEEDEMMFQNTRCSALFKSKSGKCWYINAIVWKGVEDYDTFSGRVYIDDKDFELIGSSQYVRFPFKPKTFYIDVVRVPITKEEAENRNLHYIEDGFNECYYTILKDPKQLDKVFKYYDKK